MQALRPWIFSIFLSAAGVTPWVGGCTAPSPESPELAAAASGRAQTELRQLEARWEISSPIQRRALRSELREYIDRHGSDPSVARARLLLARIALEEGRLGAAEEILKPVLRGKEGRTRDEAQVIWAGVLHERGEHEEALEVLAPLEGKLLTEDARQEFSRRRVMAALAARRWRLAIAAMITWVSQAGDQREEARDWVRRSIDRVPTRAMVRQLEDWHEKKFEEREEEATKWLRRIIIDYVTGEALERRDARLARDLLAHSPTWLRASDSGQELALLAALAQEEAQVAGRTVGVVVGGTTAEERRRSTRVAMGLVQGLRPASAGDGDRSMKILAEDERESIETTMATLMGNGASLLVAGVTLQKARDALAFAEARKVPVVSMVDPGGQRSSEYGFVFGESDRTERRAIQESAVLSGSDSPSQWVFVGTPELPCDPPLVRPGVPVFPVDQWRAEHVVAVGILGDASCARRVAGEMAALEQPLPLILGLEAAAGPLPETEALWSLVAGRYPERRDRRSSDHFRAGEGRTPAIVPEWYTVLGRDLARLTRAALKELPATTARDPAQVRKRHEQVRDALLSAKAELVSTEAKGFESGHRLRRELAVEAVSEP